MSVVDQDKSGAFNLLRNCMDVQPHNNVLVVCEDPKFGWYDSGAAPLLVETIREIGASASTTHVSSPDNELPADYAELIDRHDTIIYLARIGDQDRFTNNLPGKKVAMLYTRDAAALLSPYASTDHNAMKALKTAVDKVCLNARRITITCPMGTNLLCEVDKSDYQSDGEVTIKRFPLCVPQPVLAKHMSGKVALANWLTPTGSNCYTPANCKFDSVVFSEVENGRIVGFHGHPECVQAIELHYKQVSEKLGIDKDFIHSWHAGIHPACSYADKVEDDPDRWSNNIFGSPRFVHFHTCGDYPPGEICWMVLDPTIIIDGKPLWQNGHLMLENFDETAAVLNHWPELKELVSAPDLPIGIGV